nr:MAG TPA: hypothetical protein [Caudoviricetes sp.]
MQVTRRLSGMVIVQVSHWKLPVEHSLRVTAPVRPSDDELTGVPSQPASMPAQSMTAIGARMRLVVRLTARPPFRAGRRRCSPWA